MRRFALLAAFLASAIASNATAQNVVAYENTINFTGFAFSNGGSGTIATDTITRLVADDIDFSSAATAFNIVGFKFSVGNLNGVAVNARPRIRFYDNNGSGGGPGSIVAAFDFGNITFGSGVTVFTVSSSINFNVDGTFWAGITFDNNNGTATATQAQLDNLGQGIFNPPTIGSSADLIFRTTTFGDFNASNPTGTQFSSPFAGNPVGNFGWQFVIQVPEPSTFLMVGALLPAGLWLRRRRTAA